MGDGRSPAGHEGTDRQLRQRRAARPRRRERPGVEVGWWRHARRCRRRRGGRAPRRRARGARRQDGAPARPGTAVAERAPGGRGRPATKAETRTGAAGRGAPRHHPGLGPTHAVPGGPAPGGARGRLRRLPGRARRPTGPARLSSWTAPTTCFAQASASWPCASSRTWWSCSSRSRACCAWPRIGSSRRGAGARHVLFDKVRRLRPEEPQSLRDLALAQAARADAPARRSTGRLDQDGVADYLQAVDLLNRSSSATGTAASRRSRCWPSWRSTASWRCWSAASPPRRRPSRWTRGW